jgi:hypothetical protein
VRNVSYEDEIYMLSLVLRELEHGAGLDVQSTRFLERFQADIAFLDEALADCHATLCGNPHLPGRLGHLRSLHRVETGFAAFLAELARGSNALGKALAPLRDALLAIEGRHGELARAARSIISGAVEGGSQEQHVISDEEFRILLADESAEADGPG